MGLLLLVTGAENFALESVNTKSLCIIKVCLKAQTIRKSFDIVHKNPYCYTNGNLYTNRHKSKHHTSWVPDLRWKTEVTMTAKTKYWKFEEFH